MDSTVFWLIIWKLIAGVACVLVLTIGGCVGYESSLVAEMVAKGAEPMAARCSMNPSNVDKVLCIQK